EIFRRLSRAMGLAEPSLYESDEELAHQILGSGHASLEGITLEALKARGSMRLNVPQPFIPFAAGFPAPDGKLQFVSPRMGAAGLVPVAGHPPPVKPARPQEETSTSYPLSLLTPANLYFLNPTFANVEAQTGRGGALRVLIHPADAAARGIVDG